MRSTAFGLNNTVIMLFSATIPLISGWILEVASKNNPANLIQSDFLWAFLLLSFFYVLAIIISSLILKETYCKPQKEVSVLRKD